MKLSKAGYQDQPMLAHEFLADVPLLDSWFFELKGGGSGRTIADFRSLWTEDLTDRAGFFVRSLFAIRKAVGNVMGWDDKPALDRTGTYLDRLPGKLKENSLVEPGSDAMEPFWVIYETADESLDEVINKTVHAFSCMKLITTEDGYRVLWGIYVKPVGGFTKLYMAAIKPFRHFFVYPKIIGLLQAAWAQKYGG